MTPEASFVAALAKGESERLPVLDWELASELATRHQVAGLCSWMWRNAVICDRDASALLAAHGFEQRMRIVYLHHLLRNEALARDLAWVHDSLQVRGIKALYFKGPWLALCAYPDAGTRPVGDIDLGIAEADYGGAVAALTEAGYSAIEPLPATPERALRRAHYGGQIRFQAPGRRPVELHFRLVNFGPPALDERWVWETARTFSIGSKVLLVPGPQAMLLHVLLHANQHGFALLRLLHDIRWALERDRGTHDAAELGDRARALRCAASCYHGLVLARDLAGAVVADSLLDAVRPSRLRCAVFARVWHLPAVRRLEGSRSRTELESALLYFLEMGAARERIRFFRELLVEAGGAAAFIRRARGVRFSVERRDEAT